MNLGGFKLSELVFGLVIVVFAALPVISAVGLVFEHFITMLDSVGIIWE